MDCYRGEGPPGGHLPIGKEQEDVVLHAGGSSVTDRLVDERGKAGGPRQLDMRHDAAVAPQDLIQPLGWLAVGQEGEHVGVMSGRCAHT